MICKKSFYPTNGEFFIYNNVVSKIQMLCHYKCPTLKACGYHIDYIKLNYLNKTQWTILHQ